MKLNLKSITEKLDSKDQEPQMKLMLIDDEEPNLFGLSAHLRTDYEVTTFLSATEALSFIEKNPDQQFAAIVSDHIMPTMTGVEFFTELNKKNHDAFRILLTGYAGLDNVVAAINEASIYRYLRKPVDTHEITAVVKEAVNHYKVSKENIHLIDQMRKHLYIHQLDQIKKGKILEETMPIGKGEASVICFDIIGSSKIEHPKVKDFLRSVFAKCGQIMMENYDPDKLESNAYRIKELGDGFLCSVGFPFKTPEGRAGPELAYELAIKFTEAFHCERNKFKYDKPIHCAVGIGAGEIEGFYPYSHPIEYDLFGRSIVLATRYEQMRKVVLESVGENKDIILIQKEVFDCLSNPSEKAFCEFDLEKEKVIVRDDPNAKTLYYKFIDLEDGVLGQDKDLKKAI